MTLTVTLHAEREEGLLLRFDLSLALLRAESQDGEVYQCRRKNAGETEDHNDSVFHTLLIA